MDLEIQEMLRKGAIEKVESPCLGQYLSLIFLVPKKDSVYRPVINLKGLNRHIEYHHFKMESLSLLKELQQKGEFLCKLEECLFFSAPPSEIPKVCEIRVEESNLPVSMPLFWSKSSSQSLHKIDENSYGVTEAAEHSSSLYIWTIA